MYAPCAMLSIAFLPFSCPVRRLLPMDDGLSPQQIAARVKARRTLAANASRDTQILELAEQGLSYPEIGSRFQLSRQRVRIIVNRMQGRAA